uniref:Uncharacterized protein TCIL3000_8_7070 n=1 Tax=Trypanosoma congolense (strain IL3000) TaxID=1068625 RepID=G0USW6_TRYCI|nr:unnamed protein product [Trypanosoma congolense IL3000]
MLRRNFTSSNWWGAHVPAVQFLLSIASGLWSASAWAAAFPLHKPLLDSKRVIVLLSFHPPPFFETQLTAHDVCLLRRWAVHCFPSSSVSGGLFGATPDMTSLRCTRSEFGEMATQLAEHNGTWELRRKMGQFGGDDIVWLEGTYALVRGDLDGAVEHLLVTFFLSYSECYSQPQLHFALEHPISAVELSTWMTGVCCFADEGRSHFDAPIVSVSFCEELEMALWCLHQCDATQLMSAAVEGGARGNLLEVFLAGVAPFVGIKHESISIQP